MNEVVSVNKLSKSYNESYVVKDLNISVEKGSIFGLLGANGAGKTTAIECILGIRKPFEGEVKILGMEPQKDRKKLFQKVGVQFQESNYQQEIRVDELCEETSSFYKNVTDWRELLKKFGLKDKEKSAVKSLSGGERQRLFIVLALIQEPEVVFLDELTTGLDTKARMDVWKVLNRLKKEGLTIILVSHFMDEVEKLCDKICILKKGETIYQGTVTQAIKNSPYDKLEQAYLWYLGEEEMENEDIW